MALRSRLLAALSPWRTAPAWRIALSGGLDSCVLLHLLATLAGRQRLPPLSALHVHHGLQAAADAWPAHCQALCERLGLPLQVLWVTVDDGASVERAAREARYAAFAGVLGAGEVLLTAQHREDQAETLLLRLLRGAGVRGLAGMPASRELGRGHLLRPLLQCSRAELEAYARAEGLDWIEDPSNADRRFTRNYLRHEVMPVLGRRWPRAAESLARAAGHLGEAQALLAELADADLAACRSPSRLPWLELPSLELAPLLGLSPARQRNALRHWLAALTPLPDSDHWAGWTCLRDAAEDAQPRWCLGAGELRRGAGRLWWLPAAWRGEPAGEWGWAEPERPLPLPGNGQVSIAGVPPPGPLRVAYRRGGEVLAVPGRGHRDLKRLLNEAGLPAFLRGRLPLLYRGEQLLAVANCHWHGAPEWRLRWLPPSPDAA